MSRETSWFQDYGLDDPHERCYWRRVAAVVVAAVFLAVILGPMYGCAVSPPSPRSEVCTMQLLGQTENRVPVVGMTCVSPEEFAESQK